jgi:hypothetical protein
LPEEFLAIVSEKSNIKHEHISAKSKKQQAKALFR